MRASLSIARIPDSRSEIAFLQFWNTESAKAQNGWLQDMRANIHLLQAKPGFVSMTLHRSLDQKNLCVYAQWTDQGDLESAVNDPTVQGARERLDRWGQPDGRTYTFHSLTPPPDPRPPVLEISVDHAITSVNVWGCGDSTRQKQLLAAMEEEVAVIASKNGFLGMALHASLDGTYVGVYARWQSLAAFRGAVEENPKAQNGRTRLSAWGTPKANVFSVDGVYLPLSRKRTGE